MKIIYTYAIGFNSLRNATIAPSRSCSRSHTYSIVCICFCLEINIIKYASANVTFYGVLRFFTSTPIRNRIKWFPINSYLKLF